MTPSDATSRPPTRTTDDTSIPVVQDTTTVDTTTADDESLDDATLDGHTTEELSDYLDRGRQPVDPSIEASPGCRMALAGMERLRSVTRALLEQDAATERESDERWLRGILDSISREARSGRDIPVASDHPAARLRISEGAVRGLLRSAGDGVAGVVVGRCRLDGDITVPGVPITVSVDASVLWGTPIIDAADRVRHAMNDALALHTDLLISAIDVTVHDVHGHSFEPGTP